MNNRVKELRKAIGLSGEKFGERIGLTRMAISNLERGRYQLTEQTILSICREFHVSEEWLRTGEGEMFKDIEQLSLDELAKTNHIDELEYNLLKAYFTLDPDIRRKALEHFKSTLK